MSAPATFQAVMNNLFNPPISFQADSSLNPRHQLSNFAIVFIAFCADEHKRHIEIVLSELCKHEILLKISCSRSLVLSVFGLRLSLLIWVIQVIEITPDPKKVQSVVDWPTPTCLRKVLQFLGLIKLIQGYANMNKPLTDLGDYTFKALKQFLTSAPALAFPDPDKPFELVCVRPQALVRELFCSRKGTLLGTSLGR